eukprot:9534596-Alexandrium_andersonii.AAC.1
MAIIVPRWPAIPIVVAGWPTGTSVTRDPKAVTRNPKAHPRVTPRILQGPRGTPRGRHGLDGESPQGRRQLQPLVWP